MVMVDATTSLCAHEPSLQLDIFAFETVFDDARRIAKAELDNRKVQP